MGIVSSCKQKKIGLLAPYSGSNLGDGAIQRAAIENIRKLDSTVKLYGITLYPEDTEQRHGIPCYPITCLMVEFYSVERNIFPTQKESAPERTTSLNEVPADTLSSVERIKEVVKAVPLLADSLRFLLRRIYEIHNVSREIRSIVQAYKFVRQLDLLIVSGSGQINDEWGGPWGLPYSLFRWAMLAKIAKTPFVVASVGSGSLQPLSQFFMKRALASACYRSYREPGTKKFVSHWPFTREDPCVPDLAFSLDLSERISSNAREENGLIVGIGPISFGHPDRWPEQQLKAYEIYTKALAEFIAALAKCGHRIVFFSSSGADRGAISDITKIIREQSLGGERCTLNSCSYPSINTVEDLLEQLDTVDCVVASRLHGVLLSHVLNKPTIAISWNRKVEAQMNEMNQLEYCLDIHDIDMTRLYEAFSLLERNLSQSRAIIFTRVQGFRNEVIQQYKRILEFVTTANGLEERKQ